MRGFAELGVDVGGEPGWVELNDGDRVVTVNTLGRSWVILMMRWSDWAHNIMTSFMTSFLMER